MSLVREIHGILAPDRRTTAASTALLAMASMADALAARASSHEICDTRRTPQED